MKTIYTVILIALSFQDNYAQTITPPTIKRVDSRFVDFRKEPAQGITWVYPSQTYDVIVGYIFEIALHLIVKDKQEILDSLYGVVCMLP
ncbi:MAG: hypothetical protein AB1728_02105, partial [Bacteroidota bacterium]